MTVGLWNVQWSKPSTARGDHIRALIVGITADVLCLTETDTNLVADSFDTIASDPDYGYTQMAGRRKVLLGSRRGWRDVDRLGSSGLPSGRFVAGTTETPLGMMRFVGVCIPWADAHVRTGRADRTRWEDHRAYLRELPAILRLRDRSIPWVLLGDFNQRVPPFGQPREVFDLLLNALKPDFQIVTTEPIVDHPNRTIDHLAVTKGLQASGISAVECLGPDGRRLTDHIGLRIVLELQR